MRFFIRGTRRTPALSLTSLQPLSRISSDNLINRFLNRGGVPFGGAYGGLPQTAENDLVRLPINKIDHQRTLGILLDVGVHCPPSTVASKPRAINGPATSRHNVQLLSGEDGWNDVQTGVAP